MATTSNRNAGASSPPQQGGGSIFRPLESPSSDWLGPLILNAKTLAAGVEILPFPYVQGVFKMVVSLLETVERVKKNRESLKELCGSAVDIIKILRDQISSHGDTAAVRLKDQCEEFEGFLQDVVHAAEEMQKKNQGFRGRIKEVVKSTSTTDDISTFRDRIREVQSNFMFMINVDTNLQVQEVLSVISTKVSVPQVPHLINNCPAPTRIFHGRQAILRKMHQYFKQDVKEQQIFLLYGLGGAGKTQIALKFIAESTSCFTDIFFIDMSTLETIDSSLKTIATTKSVGQSSQDALQWLRSKQDEWLLFLDNADDPKINLNDYFPQCTHWNILITSRNPGLCVYTRSHSHVSEMEESDAVNLLLRSAAQDITHQNKTTATEIVKVLYCLPLAIIQAGAFVAKCGNLNNYLALYDHNRARLLSQKPAQSHDNYAWTVYTTWKISFDQLSQQAQKVLQLFSFLHYQGISEEIFKNASTYKCKPSGPSNEELQMAFEVLSMFLGHDGVWDSLCFMEVTNEIVSYSLIEFEPEKNMFSMHPLVHNWTHSTIPEETSYHDCMAAIVGMAIAGQSQEVLTLTSPWILPHIDSLIKDSSDVRPDFRLEYGKVYTWMGRADKAKEFHAAVVDRREELLDRDHPATLEAMFWLAWSYNEMSQWKEAKELEVVVLEKQKTVLGDNHPDTLHTMRNLAWTYHQMGRFQEAQELGVTVLEKQRSIRGDNHPDTLNSMNILALTYRELGRLQEAEELGVVVLNKQSTVLGENHPDTLRTMGNLALTYRQMGRLQEAEELEVQVLNKRRNILGDNHPDILISMPNLGLIYIELGRLQEAKKIQLVVLQQRRTILGDHHPRTLRAIGNLAITYRASEKFTEAMELELVVLEKRKKLLGNHHPDTLIAMRNLGSTFNKLERWQEAEDILLVALEKQTELFGQSHIEAVKTMSNLAVTYDGLKKLKEAKVLNAILGRN